MVQLVECLLAKEKVTGSSPVARSLFFSVAQFLKSHMATWPSGKARVCKTLITGSNPVVASKYNDIKSSGKPLVIRCFLYSDQFTGEIHFPGLTMV